MSAQLKVNSSGQVGIKTASPQYDLHVVGNTYVTGNIYLGSASNFLSVTNDNITFKVNNVLAGSTGSHYNVSFGYGALYSLTTGIGNTAVGYQSLYYNTGNSNTATGSTALFSNTTGGGNTADGDGALNNNISGNSNTAVGCWALNINSTGSNNTSLGYNANVNAVNLSNTTAIGYNAIATASDQVRIGNSSVAGIGGPVGWTNFSDGRAKKNIRTEVPGLAFINRLQPVIYNFDLDIIDELQKSDDPKINHFRDSLRTTLSSEEREIEAKARTNREKQVYSGFIAQDVEQAARSIGYDFSGVDAPENDKGPYGLRYAEFVVPLVKAVQELSEQNERLQEQINELKGNDSLRSSTDGTETPGAIDPVIAQCQLYQNTPNPFSQNTQIRFYIPGDIKTALLCIYNLQGSQIKQIVVTERGEGSQWISGSELSAGMYLYALIVDGKEVDVKRMILTK